MLLKPLNNIDFLSLVYYWDIDIFHTLYWISSKLFSMHLPKWGCPHYVVYLLPLLFSSIADLGQLDATSHSEFLAVLGCAVKRNASDVLYDLTLLNVIKEGCVPLCVLCSLKTTWQKNSFQPLVCGINYIKWKYQCKFKVPNYR